MGYWLLPFCPQSCKLPFLVTLARVATYAILAPSNLQDLYNIPRGENSAKIRKNPHPRAKKQIEEAPRWKAW
jgi:hypothetical protein